MTKTDALFMTKTAKKNIPFRAVHTYSVYSPYKEVNITQRKITTCDILTWLLQPQLLIAAYLDIYNEKALCFDFGR